MSFLLPPIVISGKEVSPIIEGGKGIAVTNGQSAGAWSRCDAVGTFSAVNADVLDNDGNIIPVHFNGKNRKERFEEMVAHAIDGGISQARVAHQISSGKGRIHLNALWEAGGTERILAGILSEVQGLVHGITCGAGLPFNLGRVAAKHKVHFYPIVSSSRAFKLLWKRSYHKFHEWLGGVVYEDPWLAGGHNGLSGTEYPDSVEAPFGRVLTVRQEMNQYGLNHIPIIMAGGVWFLREWNDWISNKELGPIAFQFGTRSLLTQESPISNAWKKALLGIKKGDVVLNKFSPTGFYSSAVNNEFLKELRERLGREVSFTRSPTESNAEPFMNGNRKKAIFVTKKSLPLIESYIEDGHSVALSTPDSSLVFVSNEKAQKIRRDQLDCIGCLSKCKFSNWSDTELGTTGKKADPRSFCIQKTLQNIGHGDDPSKNLMFAGHSAYRFSDDPLYQNGFVPTVKQLINHINEGN